jgi:hypothetical protein
MGYGRRSHNDIKACIVRYGVVYYSSGPLGPLHSADPTLGREQYGITARIKGVGWKWGMIYQHTRT